MSDSVYIKEPELAGWGFFLTFYALGFKVEAGYLLEDPSSPIYGQDLTGDGVIDVNDAVTYIITNPTTVGTLGLPYSLLMTTETSGVVAVDDSGHDFDPANPGLGGKLTYIIDAVCIPVNELIIFESTWTKVP